MLILEIIQEKEIELRGLKYNQITYETGETILKRFDPKAKMWVVCKFRQDDDSKQVKEIQETVVKMLTGVL